MKYSLQLAMGAAVCGRQALQEVAALPYVMGLLKSIDFRVRPPVKSFLRLISTVSKNFRGKSK